MRPGYSVPPVTRPRGCHVPEQHLKSVYVGLRQAWQEERTVVEPVPEALKAMGDQVFCCAEVEPGVDCRSELH
mgnify:CR=1 FL=1